MDLNYRVQGLGQPVVILHGLFGSCANWNSVAQYLARHYQVYCLDLRNHGNSDWAPEMGYAQMAADTLEFLHARGLQQATLVGHSMGGKVAMLFALSYPQHCPRLIVLDMAPARYPTRFDGMIRAMQQVPLESLQKREQADQGLRSQVPAPELRAFLLQNLVRGRESWRWRINLPVLLAALEQIHDFPELPEDASYPQPTLFLHGADSDYLRPEHHPQIQRLFPAAQITALPNAGHWLHAERPVELCAHLLDFLG